MDHLPAIENSLSKQWRVRCICLVDDAFKPFVVGYPESKGWLIRHGELGLNGVPAAPAQIEEFVQEWLFFGILKDTLRVAGIDVNLYDFVQDESVDDKGCRQLMVTTSPLRSYLDRWANREQDADSLRRKECQSLVLPILQCVSSFFTHNVDSGQRVSLDLDIALSILILAETLKNAATFIWRLPPREAPLRNVGFFRRHNLLKDRLLASGRCLSETGMLHHEIDNTGLYIAASLPWPKVTVKQSHDACTIMECLANQVDEASYQTVHAMECQQPLSCPFVPVSVGEVVATLRRGEIPLIKVKSRGDGQAHDGIELEILSGVPYVAFSHVWAHGLGNVHSNALPRCQLLRLKHLASDLFRVAGREGEPLIWIDTLCIPVDPSLSEYRKLSIMNVARTFSCTNHVLVLDAELQQTSVNCLRAELATRLFCSGWMRRLWTLEEAIVAEAGQPNCQRLCLQLREGPVALNSLLEGGLYTSYYSEKAIQAIFSRFPQFGSASDLVYSLSHALEYRTTSKSTDEAICLTSIMGLDVEQVIQAGNSSQARMHAFYAQLGQIPPTILFHHGQSLQVEGYRWAPLSFLSTSNSDSTFYQSNPSAGGIRDENGLHVQFAGYIITKIKPPRTPTDHFHFVDPEDSSKIWRLVPVRSGIDFFASRENWLQERGRLEEFNRAIYESKVVGLILDPERQLDGVMVRVEKNGMDPNKEEQEIWGRLLGRMTIYPISMKEKEKEKDELERKGDVRVNARKVSRLQRWCVA